MCGPVHLSKYYGNLVRVWKSHQGDLGKPPWKLLLVQKVSVKDDDYLKDVANVHTGISISLVQAILRRTVNVKTLMA